MREKSEEEMLVDLSACQVRASDGMMQLTAK